MNSAKKTRKENEKGSECVQIKDKEGKGKSKRVTEEGQRVREGAEREFKEIRVES